MMFILLKTFQIGFISLIVFLALYILIIFIMNRIQTKKDKTGFLSKIKKNIFITSDNINNTENSY